MSKQCRSFELVLLAAASANAVCGQAADCRTYSVTITVPFEFRAGDQTMPAGRYAFQKDDAWSLMLICWAGAECTPVQVRRARTRDGGKEGPGVLVLKGASRRLVLVQISADEAYVFPGFRKDVLRTVDGDVMYERIQGHD